MSIPPSLLDAPVLGQHLPEVLTTAEVDRMKAGIDVSKWEGQRNRAIIEVLFSCGLRVSELVSLHLSDLYLDQHFVRVLGKGQKERLVPISDAAIRELQALVHPPQRVENQGRRCSTMFFSTAAATI